MSFKGLVFCVAEKGWMAACAEAPANRCARLQRELSGALDAERKDRNTAGDKRPALYHVCKVQTTDGHAGILTLVVP
jgi:hypothetical protein